MQLYYKINTEIKKYHMPPAGEELIKRYGGVSRISNFSSKNRVRWFNDAFFTTVYRTTVLQFSDRYPKNVVDYCKDPQNSRVHAVWYFDIHAVMRSGIKSSDRCLKSLSKWDMKHKRFIHL